MCHYQSTHTHPLWSNSQSTSDKMKSIVSVLEYFTWCSNDYVINLTVTKFSELINHTVKCFVKNMLILVHF